MTPVKLIIAIASAMGATGLLAWLGKKVMNKTLKVDEVIDTVEKISEEPSETEKLKALLLLIYNQEQGVVEQINSFYISINVNTISVKENDPITIDDEEILPKQIEALTEYVTQLSRIKECFQSNTYSFKTEYSNYPENKWGDWNNHLRFAYRDITILADAILDAIISTKEEVFYIEVIEDKTNVLKALQEHYSNNKPG